MNEIKNTNNTETSQDADDLFKAILSLKNSKEAHRFFRDLLTEKELIEFGQRWKVARMLANRTQYLKIEQETGMSSATIARVHKWLKKGMGGYALILERLKKKS